jgi:uncharacterized protein (DUF885 family)
VSDQGNPAAAVSALSQRFWDRAIELSPVDATLLGYPDGLDRLPDPGPQGRAEWVALYRDTIATADSIEADPASATLPQEERVTLDILRVICVTAMEQEDQRVDRLKLVDQIEGPQTILPMLAALQPKGTPAQLDAFLARLADYPRFMGAVTDAVAEGLAAGLTAASIVTERTIGQLERVLSLPDEQSPVMQGSNASGAAAEKILDAVRRHVRPADTAFLDFLRGPYRAASRREPGLWSAPNGDAIYRTQIRAWTSLDLEPADLHRIGLEELEQIEAERVEISRELGFGDDTTAARRALKSDPANIPASVDELLDRARGQIDRAMVVAPKYFGRLPVAKCEVRPVEAFKEADAPMAYYYPPAADGSRGGIYFVNTYDLPSRSYLNLADTSFHEAVPGHHFQIALESEHPSLDAFRRHGARVAGMAYVEGWGLYAERLADEMGLYLGPVERFGMLDSNSFRAARLVVDTGLHAFKWTRERGVAQLIAAGLSETDANIETDRYICWPAQALSYKVGQREIQRLRAEATSALGSRFDLRTFHDALLGHGTLPLATLARELPGWLGYSR